MISNIRIAGHIHFHVIFICSSMPHASASKLKASRRIRRSTHFSEFETTSRFRPLLLLDSVMVTREAWMMFGLVKVVVGAIWMHTALHARTRANFLETWITNRVCLLFNSGNYISYIRAASIQKNLSNSWIQGSESLDCDQPEVPEAANPNHAHTLSFWSDLSTERVWRKDGGCQGGVGEQGRVVVVVIFYQLIRYKDKYKDKHTLTQRQTQTGRREGGVGCWEGRAVTVGVLSVVVVGPGPSVRHLQ